MRKWEHRREVEPTATGLQDETTSLGSDSTEGKALKRIEVLSPMPADDASANELEQFEHDHGFIFEGEIGREININAINQRLIERGYKIQ